MIFEPADSITAEKIRTEIERSIGTYDTRATIQNIEVFLAKDLKGFSVDIDVKYKGERGILTLTFDENTFNEVLLGT